MSAAIAPCSRPCCGRTTSRSRGSASSPQAAAGAASTTSGGEPALVALRARVVARYGPEFIARRSAELTARLAALEPAPSRPAIRLTAVDDPLPPSYTFSERFRDTSQALAALDVLDGARPPGPGASIATPSMPLRLQGGETAMVTKLADALEESLIRLLDTARPDWGLAMLVGMARLTALRETVAHGTVGRPRRLPRRRTGPD